MVYKALYREWRPQTFADVVGQNHVSRTLRNALARDQIAHAYLFSGPRGTGKTTIARLLAKAVNCIDQDQPEPCNQCQLCQTITSGSSVDVQEIDAASNRGIDEIRDLRDKIRYYPVECRYKVYIIDEVHMLTEPAFNALLKTLEDPPKHVIFILATTEPHKLPATIISRCQRFDFHRLSLDMIMQRLEEVAEDRKVLLTAAARRAIARAAEGGLRDALSLLDQCLALGEESIDAHHVEELLGKAGEDVCHEICRCLQHRDVVDLMRIVDQLVLQGRDIRQLAADLCDYVRDLLLAKLGDASTGLDLDDPSRRERLQAMADEFTVDYLLRLIKAMVDTESEIRRTGHARLLMEMTLIKALPDLPQTQQLPSSSEEMAVTVEPAVSLPQPQSILSSEKEGTEKSTVTVEERWETIMGKLRKAKKLQVAAWLQPVQPLWNEDEGSLTLIYPRQYSIHKDKVEVDPQCLQALEVAGAEVFGRPVKFKTRFEDEGNPVNEEQPALEQEQDPLVRLALQIFDGEIIGGQ